jgi:hypothetical protein
MKTLTSLLAAVLLSGCAYNYPYSHSSIGAGAAPPEVPSSQYTIVNNTDYKLAVYQDGQYIGDLNVGGVFPVRGGMLWRNTVVTVTGTDPDGRFIGSASWKYQFGIPEAWTVVSLNAPRPRR